MISRGRRCLARLNPIINPYLVGSRGTPLPAIQIGDFCVRDKRNGNGNVLLWLLLSSPSSTPVGGDTDDIFDPRDFLDPVAPTPVQSAPAASAARTVITTIDKGRVEEKQKRLHLLRLSTQPNA
jgi:hypothetical protein